MLFAETALMTTWEVLSKKNPEEALRLALRQLGREMAIQAVASWLKEQAEIQARTTAGWKGFAADWESSEDRVFDT